MTYEDYLLESEHLAHHGVLGMRWGIRRYQPYPDNYRGDGKYLGKKVRRLEKTQAKLERNVERAQKAASKGQAKKVNKLNARTEKLIKREARQTKRVEKAQARYDKNARINEELRSREVKKLLEKGTAEEILAKADKLGLNDTELRAMNNRLNGLRDAERYVNDMRQMKFDAKLGKVKRAVAVGETAVSAFGTYEKVANIVNIASGKDVLPEFTKKYEAAKKAKEDAKLKSTYEIMRSGDADTIEKNKDKLTPSEYKEALEIISKKEKGLKSHETMLKARTDAIREDAASKTADRDSKLKEYESARADSTLKKARYVDWSKSEADATKGYRERSAEASAAKKVADASKVEADYARMYREALESRGVKALKGETRAEAKARYGAALGAARAAESAAASSYGADKAAYEAVKSIADDFKTAFLDPSKTARASSYSAYTSASKTADAKKKVYEEASKTLDEVLSTLADYEKKHKYTFPADGGKKDKKEKD